MDDRHEDHAKRIPIRDLHIEAGAEELLQSAAMGTNEAILRFAPLESDHIEDLTKYVRDVITWRHSLQAR